MAAKLKCPNCGYVLKEEGDRNKEAQGEYRVYDSLSNRRHLAGKFRLVQCLGCMYADEVSSFDE